MYHKHKLCKKGNNTCCRYCDNCSSLCSLLGYYASLPDNYRIQMTHINQFFPNGFVKFSLDTKSDPLAENSEHGNNFMVIDCDTCTILLRGNIVQPLPTPDRQLYTVVNECKYLSSTLIIDSITKL